MHGPRRSRSTFVVLTVLALLFFQSLSETPLSAASESPNLIPCPKSLKAGPGTMDLTADSRIVAESKLSALAGILADDVVRLGGPRMTTAEGAARSGDILLQLDSKLEEEQYSLHVADRAVCRGGSYRAVCWGVSTLLQALRIEDGKASLPKISVQDNPDFAFRSALTDIARKWHPLANLRELVDLFRYYKIRYIQFHLNDHGMFTFGSQKYPKLATPNRHYTIDELKELVAYAEARGVTIIPELEMPGHSDAPRLMPEVFGTKDPETGKHRSSGMVNICRDDTIAACSELLEEVMDVFAPSPYVSIGADEVARPAIANIPEFAAYCEKHGLNNTGAVFNRFIEKMNETANRRGKTLMVYGQRGPKNVLQMPWVGNDGEFTKAGYKIVRHLTGSVTNHLVTFHKPPYNTILAYTGFTEQVYNADYFADKKDPRRPLPNPENVVGIHILSWQNWHFVTLPDFRRTMAAWNHHDKKSRRPWNAWKEAWRTVDARLDDLLFPVKLDAEGLLDPEDIVFEKSLTIRLKTSLPGTIRYRLEPANDFLPPALPTNDSPAYSGPITITEPRTIYAALFDAEGRRVGHGTERRFWPIVPKVECRVYDTDKIASAWNDGQPQAALRPKDITYAEFAKLKLEPDATCLLDRFTFHPSRRGVYLNRSYLVQEGSIRIPADGDYVISTEANAEVFLDGKPVFSRATDNAGKNARAARKPASTTSAPIALKAGIHHVMIFSGPGNKNAEVAAYLGPGMANAKPLSSLLLPLRKAALTEPVPFFAAQQAEGKPSPSTGTYSRNWVLLRNTAVGCVLARTNMILPQNQR